MKKDVTCSPLKTVFISVPTENLILSFDAEI